MAKSAVLAPPRIPLPKVLPPVIAALVMQMNDEARPVLVRNGARLTLWSMGYDV